MILHAKELLAQIDELIQEKQTHLEAIRTIETNVQQITNLDSLKGEGGDAIKEHFTMLHMPVLLFLQHFIESYILKLEEIRDNIVSFDSENTVIHSEYLEELKGNKNKLANYTKDSASVINGAYSRVSDIVNTGQLDISLILTDAETAREHIDYVLSELGEMDDTNASLLEESKATLEELTTLSAKVVDWSVGGVMISPDTAAEVSAFFEDNPLIVTLIDEATAFAEATEDPTTMGRIANWIEGLGKAHMYLEAAEKIVALSVLGSKMVTLEKLPGGDYRIVTSRSWHKIGGVHQSKVAENVHRVLQQGNPYSLNPVRRWLSQFGYQADGVLKDLAGLDPKAHQIQFGDLVKSKNSSFLVFHEELFEHHKVKVDWRSTINQFKNLDTPGTLKQLIRKIPVGGIFITAGFNMGEFFSDEHREKPFLVKSTRFAASMAFDGFFNTITVGTTALGTLGGLPGIIGGAAAGIAINIAAENAFKEDFVNAAEEVGERIQEGMEELHKFYENAIDSAIEFIGEGVDSLVETIDAGIEVIGSWFR